MGRLRDEKIHAKSMAGAHRRPGLCYTFGMNAEKKKVTLTAVLLPAEEGGFVAMNPETGAFSQGDTVEEGLANLREATELYLEKCPLDWVAAGKPVLREMEVLVDVDGAGGA